MKIRSVSCTVILLISLVVTDARTMEPVSVDKSLSSACGKCLLVSRKAETTLKSSRLFDEAQKLSEEVCNLFPAIVQDKCLKKSEAHGHEAMLVLQEFFAESHLYYSLGLYAKSEPLMDEANMIILVTRGAEFIGSHLLDKLMEKEKNEVIDADNFFTCSKDNLSKWIDHPRFELIRHALEGIGDSSGFSFLRISSRR